MATLYEQLKKAKNLSSQRISDELFNFIKSIQNKFVDLNKEQLNKNSQDIFGDPIGYYSMASEIITMNEVLLGQRTGIKEAGTPFTMEDTGDFLKGFYIEIKNDMIFFGSKDVKTPLILDNENLLSRDLFGLQDNNLRELIENDLLPFVLKFVRKELDV